ncbi:DUF7255 family protein [Cesiribacter andamanensis]|uniref:Uncharacterized protein n=1 Tax=Cesiribacter andamanensis AMV16 TaxID=1279009 RepID=M7N2W4_9BACT|nr:hypothetical protein [Cesiribacter andamanensis]EMR01566.1 hypothetical protein ADICEAN_03303 [Cesiribacter andamanensis AMV16]
MPAILNRRRIAFKKFLNRYMGLPLTQLQPQLQWDDMADAGLVPALEQLARQLFPHSGARRPEPEPVAIEVRGIALAFDEEISFSHYRFQSLQSPLYNMPFVPQLERYKAYCQFWGDIIGQQESIAISRILRMRALQDFMQDMLPVVYHMPLLRVSVYDQLGPEGQGKNLHEIFSDERTDYYPLVADKITLELETLDAQFFPYY